jgi:hypothetical protein
LIWNFDYSISWKRVRQREKVEWGDYSERHNINNNYYNYYCYRGDMKFTAQNVPMQLPPLVLVKAGWPLGRGFRVAERRVKRSGLLGAGREGRS